MRFSEHYGIKRSDADDWFDPILGQDTMLAADPYLAFADADPRWSGLRDRVFDFFRLAHQLAQRTHRAAKPSRDPAVKFLRCREPQEFCLGVATRSPAGHGTGFSIAAQMVAALEQLAQNHPDTPVTHIEVFRLFVPGVAFDLISDMFCNIVKQELIAYTQDVAKRHNIPMEQVTVKGARWMAPGRWIEEQIRLPLNPARTEATGKATGVLLIPERWLRKLNDPNEDFYSWAEYAEEAESLRTALNLDAFEELTRAEKVKAIRDLTWKHPEVAEAFLDKQEGTREPYDVKSDPDGVVRYPEVGMDLFRLSTVDQLLGEPEDDFCAWVGALARQFAHAVEQQGGWKALWERRTGEHVVEEITQAIANVFFRAHCDQKDVQVSRELDVGRGLVDFHFSRGRKFRALIEVKHMDHTRLVTGTGQLAQYLVSEQVNCGYLLCVGFTSDHLYTGEGTRRSRVEAACEAARQDKHNIRPIFVDATPKQSASKAK
jgi:hypothetical protein